MIPTVLKPIRDNVTKDQFEPWFNRELIPLLLQMRQALNYWSVQSAAYTTAATGTMTTIWTSADVAVDSSILVKTTVMGIATGATSAFEITGLFRNPGTFAQDGTTAAIYTQNTASFAVQYLVVDNHIELQVEDDGALSVDWTAVISALELS